MPAAETEKDEFKAAEVCRVANVAPYVLKYWQTEFSFLSGSKEKGANRTYTKKEVRIISRVRQLLYDEGFTIAGAKKKIEAEIAGGEFDEGARGGKRRSSARAAAEPAAAPEPVPAAPSTSDAARPASRAAAEAPGIDKRTIVRELKGILKTLEKPISK